MSPPLSITAAARTSGSSCRRRRRPSLRIRTKATLLLDFPPALEESARMARSYLLEGLTALFDERHQFAIEPALAFLYRRIGTEHFMAAAGPPA